MSLIPKSLRLTSLPAFAVAGLGRKLFKLTGARLYKRIPVSFGDAKMYITPEGSDGFTFWTEIFDMNGHFKLQVERVTP